MSANRRMWTQLLLLVVVASVSFSGCSKMKRLWPFGSKRSLQNPDGEIFTSPQGSFFDPVGGEVTALDNMPTDYLDIDPSTGDVTGIPHQALPPAGAPLGTTSELPIIYFAFDSDQLTAEVQAALDQAAQWILNHPQYIIQIEGHCDERGTVEYNLNLGQRRADRVREYLVGRGVNPAILTPTSYGEERLADPGTTEEAHAQNRRVQFVVFE